MKKILAVLLALTTVCTFMTTNTSAAGYSSGDKLVLFDADHDGGVHVDTAWGTLTGLDGEYVKDGTHGIMANTVNIETGLRFFYSVCADPDEKMKAIFPNTELINRRYDVSSYKYVEFDCYFLNDWDPQVMKMEFEFALPATLSAHSGYNYAPGEVVFEPNRWYHIRMPLDDFIIRSVNNKDAYDTEHNQGNDAPRYAADLENVARIKFQICYITNLDDEPIEETCVVLDNFVATKDNTTIAETQLETVDDYYHRISVDSSVVTPPEPSEDEIQVKYGDVDGNDRVNATDALTTLQFAVDKITLTEEQILAANVDGKGTVTSSDALMILQYSVDKISSFPVDNLQLNSIFTPRVNLGVFCVKKL